MADSREDVRRLEIEYRGWMDKAEGLLNTAPTPPTTLALTQVQAYASLARAAATRLTAALIAVQYAEQRPERRVVDK